MGRLLWQTARFSMALTDYESFGRADQHQVPYYRRNLDTGLVVRVGGFSGYFVRLNAALQDEIIARTEF